MVTSPTLGITTPVMVLVPVIVPSPVRVVKPSTSVVTLEVTVTAELALVICVEAAELARVPFAVNLVWMVVGKVLTMKDSKVVTKVDSLVTTSVSTSVNTEVKTTVVMGTVMLVVNLETDVEIGTSFAPLGRLIVELTDADVMLLEGTDVVLEGIDVVLEETDTVLLVETGRVVDDELVLSAILWSPPG
jgi:hypothetical protein